MSLALQDALINVAVSLGDSKYVLLQNVPDCLCPCSQDALMDVAVSLGDSKYVLLVITERP